MRIGILNYGIGNLYSIVNALRRLGADVVLINEPATKDIEGLVLPGVGNFESAARQILRIKDKLIELIDSSMPVLGICLGMQLFFEKSEEGVGEGLGIFRGEVVKLRIMGKLPHIGWNTLNILRDSPLLEDIKSGEWVYYVHSYYPSPVDRNLILAETHYHVSFPSVVGDSIRFGTQFHPEKSSITGQKILKNFLKICKK